MNKCKWCGASAIVGKGPDVRPEWKRLRCNGCGAFSYIHDPDKIDLDYVYDLAWKDAERLGTFAAGSTSEKISLSLLNAVKFKPKGARCLDYGGGKGHFAKALTQTGCEHLTVYEPFGQNPGLESVNWINDIKEIKEESFNWIFMIEVLEHLLEPQEEVEKLFRYLEPGGRLVITTPNAKGLRARIDGFDWREAQNPTHINLFTEQSLKACFTSAGLPSPKRVLRPVTYKAKGIRAFALSMTQMFGIDGGLRYFVVKADQ